VRQKGEAGFEGLGTRMEYYSTSEQAAMMLRLIAAGKMTLRARRGLARVIDACVVLTIFLLFCIACTVVAQQSGTPAAANGHAESQAAPDRSRPTRLEAAHVIPSTCTR
jgi:hypothetical protein